jgi:hypothetical protein
MIGIALTLPAQSNLRVAGRASERNPLVFSSARAAAIVSRKAMQPSNFPQLREKETAGR